MKRARRTAASRPSCDAVRPAISASLDGEETGLSIRAVSAHLDSCADCRRFAAEVESLMRQVSPQMSRPVPAGLNDVLAAELVRAVGPPPVSPRPVRRSTATALWRRRVRWVGALAPAATLVVVLPLGAWSDAGGKPTHASTPCTAHIHLVHRAAGYRRAR